MKQGKRKLQLQRITVRPLTAEQLARVGGGGTLDTCVEDDLIDPTAASRRCDGSVTQNYSNFKC